MTALGNQTAERLHELQHEVYALRKRVKEQRARAELWKHRALIYNRSKRRVA